MKLAETSCMLSFARWTVYTQNGHKNLQKWTFEIFFFRPNFHFSMNYYLFYISLGRHTKPMRYSIQEKK